MMNFSIARPTLDVSCPERSYLEAETSKKFNEKYELGNEIGNGAGGKVYKCTRIPNSKPGKDLVCKVMKRGVNDYNDWIKSVKQEVMITKVLEHESLCPIEEFFFNNNEGESEIRIIMPLKGQSLEGYISSLKETLDVPKICKILLPVAKGLRFMHNHSYTDSRDKHCTGVIHNDIKPDNILIDNHGETTIIDFGMSLKAKRSKQPAGTPGYKAPERIYIKSKFQYTSRDGHKLRPQYYTKKVASFSSIYCLLVDS
jgi:serine/threonine-protein kinase